MNKKTTYVFHLDDIEIFDYPFECSFAAKNRSISVEDIKDVDCSFLPPVIRLVNNELIFVFANHKDELLLFCERNKISNIKRKDLWSFILEPFLDTEFSDRTKEQCYSILNEFGINKELCDHLRDELSPRMIAYNFESCLWEWVNLGLYDALSASCGMLSGEKHKLNKNDFEKFYWYSMDIALKSF